MAVFLRLSLLLLGVFVVSSSGDSCIECSGEFKKGKVCGSDGITYSSRCELDRAACLVGGITFVSHGKCADSSLEISSTHKASQTLTFGKRGKIQCLFSGKVVEVTWRKIGSNGHRARVLSHRVVPSSKSLRFRRVELEDEGTYECRGRSGSGMFATTTIKVTILDPNAMDSTVASTIDCRSGALIGTGNNYTTRWYFDSEEAFMCEPFLYSGSGGNKNNFKDKSTCQQKCAHAAGDICSLPKKPGICMASKVRWYYDTETSKCQHFIYGGCNGNANNFDSKEACDKACSADRICTLKPESGRCLAYFPRYFYNHTSGQCDKFIYGGCEGNSNRFPMLETCQKKCKPDDLSKLNIPDKPGVCPWRRMILMFCFVRDDLCESDPDCEGGQKCCYDGCRSVCVKPILGQRKPGKCPRAPEVKQCGDDKENMCALDADCPGERKCCYDGCQRDCVVAKPAWKPKPGICQVHDAINPALCKNTKDECKIDKECFGALKCCFNGCFKECKTTPIPKPKPGQCPTVDFFNCSDLPDECDFDSDCSGRDKCCGTGCANECITPPAIEKPGECPLADFIPPEMCGNTTDECSVDADCKGRDKCCATGCSKECITPPIAEKPGECPLADFIPPELCEDTTDKCSVDADCKGRDKCCATGCLKECITPPKIEKAGLCPLGILPPDVCKDKKLTYECEEDADCKGREKCCTVGCGSRECIPPPVIKKPGLCPLGILPPEYCKDKNLTYKCSNDFDCKGQAKCCTVGCGSRECFTPPVREKPGLCPVGILPPDVCKDKTLTYKCSEDADCQGKGKCCTVGCGSRECITPLFRKKPGMCPIGILPPDVCKDKTLTYQCSEDVDCKGRAKCCTVGCGSRNCTTPLSGLKPGMCPLGSLPPEYCKDKNLTYKCSEDADCKGREKCCTVGCGSRECIPPPETEKPGLCPLGILPPEYCEDKNLTYKCSNDFDCKGQAKCCTVGCGSRECFTPPERKKPGLCPVGILPPDVCKDKTLTYKCSEDADCQGKGKCCTVGCGSRECITPPQIEKPGECAFRGLLPEICNKNASYKCSEDVDCQGQEKCCTVGCGLRECTTPLFRLKPGMCPLGLLPPDVCQKKNLTYKCKNDADCQGKEKCCVVGCGSKKCTSPSFRPKPGVCPVGILPPDVCKNKNLTYKCSEDVDCQGREKCCTVGCGSRECTTPGFIQKPGECPVADYLPPEECEDTTNKCDKDDNCPGRDKCCDTGCLKECLTPPGLPPKKGKCPKPWKGLHGICDRKGDTCSDDSTCSGKAKCCFNGCQKECIEPVPTDKPGTCPKPWKGLDGICDRRGDMCDVDISCGRREKCCFNGCQRDCVQPAPKRLQEHGRCPKPWKEQPCDRRGDLCSNDTDCFGQHVCCFNGCQRDCVSPVNMTKCQEQKQKALDQQNSWPPKLGVFIPKCKADGQYEDEQCHELYCWCVDKNGHKIPDTEVRLKAAACYARDKPGKCPKPYKGQSGLCDLRGDMCRKDQECKGDQRCCFNGCQNDCVEPVGIKLCEKQKEMLVANNGGLPAIGAFIPSCKLNGSYEEIQCWGSTGFCWCVDKFGNQLPGTETRGKPNCEAKGNDVEPGKAGTCPKPWKGDAGFCDKMGSQCELDALCPGEEKCCFSGCQRLCVNSTEHHQKNKTKPGIGLCDQQKERLAAKNTGGLPAIGAFIPSCDLNGSYEEIQCWGSTGHCWCVDKFGNQIPGTETRGKPNCEAKDSNAAPGVCPEVLEPKECPDEPERYCTAESDCPTGLKCCSTGCGTDCMTGVDAPGKAGACPKPWKGDAGFCDKMGSQCELDALCPGEEKCCFSGCQRLCVNSTEHHQKHITKPAPGVCPEVLEPKECPAEPERYCNAERDCPTGLKCCSTGCGTDCMRGIELCDQQKERLAAKNTGGLPAIGAFIPSCKSNGSYEEIQCWGSTGHCWCVDKFGNQIPGTETRGKPNCEAKENGVGSGFKQAGTCPKPWKGHTGFCDKMGSQCELDSLCPGEEKCCFSGCQRLCVNSTEHHQKQKTKPGKCAKPWMGKEGLCDRRGDMCEGDNDCKNNHICCSNGCQKDCVAPGLTTCQQRYEESFLFPDVGRFVPQCRENGGFAHTQCHPSTGFCYCVDAHGVEQLGTRTRGRPNCTVPDPCLVTECDYYGECVPSKDHKSVECKCRIGCIRLYDPVCGTNGRTYGNECEMRNEACLQKQNIAVAYKGECKQLDPCAAAKCGYYSECQVVNGSVTCVCPGSLNRPPCSDEKKPVCGSNGRVYDNVCLLMSDSCQQERYIYPSLPAICESEDDPCSGVNCSHPLQKCVVSDNKPSCVCTADFACPGILSSPVCGDDGITYQTECILKTTSCAENKIISVDYKGECREANVSDPCATVKCAHDRARCVDRNGTAVCECLMLITLEYFPVCGSDGVTYASPSSLGVASCNSNGAIYKVKNGKCSDLADPCEITPCSHKRHTCKVINSTAVCVCDTACPFLYDPLCASDNKTYDNRCAMEMTECMTDQRLRVVHKGACGSVTQECPAPWKGEHGICDYRGSTCQSDSDCQEGTCCYNGCQWDCVKFGKLECPKKCDPNAECFEFVFGGRRCVCKFGFNGDGETCLADPCSVKKCDHYATCQVEGEVAKCVCPVICPAIYLPVCGSDGKVYDNDCQMRVASCTEKKKITVASKEDCKPDPCENVECSHEMQKCVTTNEGPTCLCPRIWCTREFKPVCGTDGQTYPNKCVLETTACRQNQNIKVSSQGECSENISKPCDVPDICSHPYHRCVELDKRAVCICPMSIPMILAPVCGSDGITYSNAWALKSASCLTNRIVTERSKGQCPALTDPCDLALCGHEKHMCRVIDGNAKCVCNEACYKILRPVCGSDGVTYSNDCLMEVEACKTGKKLEVARQGQCDLCANKKCSHPKQYCKVIDEVATCLCSEICTADWNPVCGTDNKLYPNKCSLEVEACKTGQHELTVKNRGQCSEQLTCPVLNPSPSCILLPDAPPNCFTGGPKCPTGEACCLDKDCTHKCVKPALPDGSRPGTCPLLNPLPFCQNVTGCNFHDICALGEKCCLQADCTNACVEAEVPPPPPELLTCPILDPTPSCALPNGSNCFTGGPKCPTGEACCLDNDCIHKCVKPALPDGSRPGTCPILNPTPVCESVSGCKSDDGCPLGERCCLQANCENKCVKTDIPPPPPELLTCPTLDPTPSCALPNEPNCFTGGPKCRTGEACCLDQDCIHKCVKPALSDGSRPGTCPLLNPLPFCPTVAGCNFHDICALGEKCCLQADCTNACVKTVEIPPPQPRSMLVPICIPPCHPFGKCIRNAETGKHECSCLKPCPRIYRPVCGTDGKTYSTKCMMETLVCEQGSEVTIKHRGKCAEDPCEASQCSYPRPVCKVVKGEATCVCRQICPALLDPVCGSDGSTYSNMCYLEKTACILESSGLPPGTLTYLGNGYCTVAQICSLPVVKGRCEASMRRYFFNATSRTCEEFRYGGCDGNANRFDTEKECSDYCGSLDACQLHPCPDPYAICTENDSGARQCSCPQICTADHSPVCGTDSKTYSNECQMRVAACSQGMMIKVKSKGECKHNPGFCPPVDPRPCPAILTHECSDDSSCEKNQKCCFDGCVMGCMTSMPIPPNRAPQLLTQRLALSLDERPEKARGQRPCEECEFPNSCEPGGSSGEVCEPVCGTDGRNYSSVCALMAEACKPDNPGVLEVKHRGLCVCDLPPVGGMCFAYMPRFFFNSTTKQCEQFIYGGCGGNDNRFMTVEACENKCISPCKNKKCPFPRSRCDVEGGEAVCKCPQICTADYRPMCGTDGKTYGNLCALEAAACRMKHFELKVRHAGECEIFNPCKNTLCSKPRRCVVEKNVAKCKCRKFCTREYAPVCASDGKSYPNKCTMEAAGCESNQTLTVINPGKCNVCNLPPVQGMCEAYMPHFFFNATSKQCERFIYGGCGGNANRFATMDECVGKCKAETPSSDDPCQSMECEYHGVCRVTEDSGESLPACECITDCPKVDEPVCGSDGKNYSSECMLKSEACLKRQMVHVVGGPKKCSSKRIKCEGCPARKDLFGHFCNSDFVVAATLKDIKPTEIGDMSTITVSVHDVFKGPNPPPDGIINISFTANLNRCYCKELDLARKKFGGEVLIAGSMIEEGKDFFVDEWSYLHHSSDHVLHKARELTKRDRCGSKTDLD